MGATNLEKSQIVAKTLVLSHDTLVSIDYVQVVAMICLHGSKILPVKHCRRPDIFIAFQMACLNGELELILNLYFTSHKYFSMPSHSARTIQAFQVLFMDEAD